MKERPIIMTSESVKGILEDRKTQSRRVIKPQPKLVKLTKFKDLEVWEWAKSNIAIPPDVLKKQPFLLDKDWGIKCPYGKVGDRLWVRETWRPAWAVIRHAISGPGIQYRADGVIYGRPEAKQYPECQFPNGRWRPSIFMPRWAFRLLLEITGVRVERLDNITELDAIAEGVERDHYLETQGWKNYCCIGCLACSAKSSYNSLWNKLNRKRGYGWETNPWVWVIEFKVVKK